MEERWGVHVPIHKRYATIRAEIFTLAAVVDLFPALSMIDPHIFVHVMGEEALAALNPDGGQLPF